MSTYPKDGHKLPSVTTIISDCTDKSGALTQWAANQVVEWIRQNCPPTTEAPIGDDYWVMEDDLYSARMHFREVSQTALDVGSEVHALIEKWLGYRIDEPTYPPDGIISRIENPQVANAFGAFAVFAYETNMLPIELEQAVYGDCWAGTLDFYGWLNGQLTVIDFKTSKSFYPSEMRPQIAAYRSCRPDATASGILRLDKATGVPEYKDYSKHYINDLAVFQAMVQLYMLRHPRIAAKAGWGK